MPPNTLIECESERVVGLMLELFPNHRPSDIKMTSKKRNGDYDITLLEPYSELPIHKKLSTRVFNTSRPRHDRYILHIPSDPSTLHHKVTILMYIARKLEYPVPELVAYSATDDNALGKAYILQTHLPGQSLFSLWPSLNFAQRKSAVRCMARVFRDIFCTTNPCAGCISVMNSTQDIQNDLPRIEPFSVSPLPSLSSSLSSPSFSQRNPAVVQSSQSLLLSLCSSRLPSFPHLSSSFTRITNSLSTLSLLPSTPSPFHLHNPSLTSHTLLLTVSSPTRVFVSGLPSWSSTVFAPKFVSARSPWEDVVAHDTTHEEWVQCMMAFYEEVGGEYAEWEDRRECAIARRMWRVLIEGIKEGGDLRVAEGVVGEWGRMFLDEDGE